jgi:hypothetical protein
MNDDLRGWDEIAGYLRVHRRTAQRYAKTHGLLIHHPPGGGPKSPVYAFKSELDKWQRTSGAPAPTVDSGFAEQLLRRISALSFAKSLYRKNFALRFTLQRAGTRVQGRVETEYELLNGSNEKQPYIQEVTIDDCERGYVEQMSVSADGKPISFLKRPEATQRLGFASYQGPKLLIEPSASGRIYTGKAAWIINRSETDYWYLHVGIPTFCVEVETAAPPDFEITPSYFVTDLLMIGEHLDITWKRRERS